MTLIGLQGHLHIASFFKCNYSYVPGLITQIQLCLLILKNTFVDSSMHKMHLQGLYSKVDLMLILQLPPCGASLASSEMAYKIQTCYTYSLDSPIRYSVLFVCSV